MTGPEDHSECEAILILLPEFALGSLEIAEGESVRRHVHQCPPCWQEMSAFRRVADALLIAPTPVAPSPLLRRRVLEAAGIVPAPAMVTLWDRFRAIVKSSSGFLRPSPAFAFAALAIALGVGYQSLQLQTELDRARVENSALQAELASKGQIFADVLRPDVTVWRLRGTEAAPIAKATLYCNPASPTGILSAADLPPLPANQVYQLWLIRDGQRTSGGLLAVDYRGTGVLTITAPEPFSAYQAVGMTVEPAGGSPGPTGPRVLSGQLY